VCACVHVCVCVCVCGVSKELSGFNYIPPTLSGVSREDFMKLMQHSEIPGPERAVLMNLMHFGTTIITEVGLHTRRSCDHHVTVT
jgi:hypothetical protein